MNEIRRLEEFPNYGASSLGVIYRLDTGKVMAPTVNSRGYLELRLYNHGKASRTVHRLVAEAFLGKRPPGLEINHKNGIKNDNRLENLEYITKIENIRHAKTLGLWPSREGAKNGRSKLSEKDILGIRASKKKVEQIAIEYGVSQQLISRVRLGDCWKHVK